MKSYNVETFGKELKKIRQSHGLSQKKVSELTKIDRSTIQRIEYGQNIPSFDTIVLLSTLYRTDLMTLFNKHVEKHILVRYYEVIDRSIIDGDLSKIKSLYDDLQSLAENPEVRSVIDHVELEQFFLYYKAINYAYEDIDGHKGKIQNTLLELLRQKHFSFSIANFKKYHYSFIEIRSLFTYAMTLRIEDRERSTEILLYLLQELDSEFARAEDVSIMLKLCLNIATNYYFDEKDQESYDYAKKGIDLANKYHLNLFLGDLLMYRGIAEYHLNYPASYETLKCAYYTYKSCSQDNLADQMLTDLNNSLNLELSV